MKRNTRNSTTNLQGKWSQEALQLFLLVGDNKLGTVARKFNKMD